MIRRSAALLTMATLLISGCGEQTLSPAESQSTRQEAQATDVDSESSLPKPDPAFARHFTDPVYQDEGGEFAPFGTDEGSDMVYEWAERRDELSTSTTVADLIDGMDLADVVQSLDTPEKPGIPEPAGQVDAATITIGAGFTLLRLTGHIDDEGRKQTLKALDILIRRYGSPPELLRQRTDLLSWHD